MFSINGSLMRIFIGESDKYDGMPLYEWIIRKSKEQGMAGTTVIRGMEGFGSHNQVHTSKSFAISTDLPLVIEIIDEHFKIEYLLNYVRPVMHDGLITIDDVHIHKYGSDLSHSETPLIEKIWRQDSLQSKVTSTRQPPFCTIGVSAYETCGLLIVVCLSIY